MPIELNSPDNSAEEYLYSLSDDAVEQALSWLQINPKSLAFTEQLNAQLSDIDYAKKLQEIAKYCHDVAQSSSAFMALFTHILSPTIDGLSISGLAALNPNQKYLFISNHRDVLLDPLLINLALQQQGLNNARCAIGSNLLEDDLLATYLRLSGCFVVPREDLPMRTMLQRLRQLSEHINTLSQQHNIWIAQREGRAKDGWDITNPALIKMLLLANKKTLATEQYLQQKHIVPVSISYEWDPSDKEKAEELALKPENSEAVFRSDSLQHLQNSLLSKKGRVHLGFGKPLHADNARSPSAVADHLDQFIQCNFQLYPSHLAAYKMRHGKGLTGEEAQALQHLNERAGLASSQAVKDNLLDLYANIAEQRLAAN